MHSCSCGRLLLISSACPCRQPLLSPPGLLHLLVHIIPPVLLLLLARPIYVLRAVNAKRPTLYWCYKLRLAGRNLNAFCLLPPNPYKCELSIAVCFVPQSVIQDSIDSLPELSMNAALGCSSICCSSPYLCSFAGAQANSMPFSFSSLKGCSFCWSCQSCLVSAL